MKIASSIKLYLFRVFRSSTLINVMIVGIMTFLVKGMGFFKEMEVGRSFGLSEFIDTFLIASIIPGFINNVFTSSFQNVFIPNYIAQKKVSNNISSFQSACIIITICLGTILAICSYIFIVLFLEDIFTGHSFEYYELVRSQFYIMLPCVLFWSLSSFLGGLLEINGFFSFSSIYPIITSIVILICLFFFKSELGYKLLAFGILIGSFLEFVYLLWVSIIKKTLKLSKPDFFSPNIVTIFRQLPLKVGSGFLTGTTGFINQFFASNLIAGSIGAFNFGMKLPSFLSSILITSIGNVVLPYFSVLVNENREKAYGILYKSILYTFIFSLSISGILIFLSKEVISFLFEKGNFSSENTVVVSRIQQILLVYVPFYISSIIIIKFLTSINRNSYMFYASILNLILNLLLNYCFVKIYGINGLAIATTVVYVINFGVLFLFVNSQRKRDSIIGT